VALPVANCDQQGAGIVKSTPVISFVGKSGSGKTTLLEKVVSRLKKDGIMVAVIKHDAHCFDMDKPGKDTWRMAQAGADVVAISSPEKVAVLARVAEEKSLDEVIAMIPEVDIVLTEGYKTGDKPKIEVFRSEAHHERLRGSNNLLAMASDIEWDDLGVPCYHIDDAEGVAGEVRKYLDHYCKARERAEVLLDEN
jgi:molybdopterin-guanine dinucleotide biosynthesis protein B